MSNIIILGDTHFGHKSESDHYQEYQKRNLDNMLSYMSKHGINTILQLGDLFDKRKSTNHTVLDFWENNFFKKLHDQGITMHTLIGNHDCVFKNTLTPNAQTLFLSKYENIKIHTTPKDVEICGLNFLILPWICDDNRVSALDAIQKSKSIYCAGHLELINFEMNRGQVSHEGMDHKIFRKFDCVFSGHYHTRSSSDNIRYVGSPFEISWADYNDPRGFHVFNTENHKISFKKNASVMFTRIEYDDQNKGVDYSESIDVSNVVGSNVRLIVVNKTDQTEFDKFIEKLYNMNPDTLNIIEDYTSLVADAVDDDDISLETSIDLINSYVDTVDYSGNKDGLKNLMKTLYVEASAAI